jgi:hypothetical protein
VVTVHNRGESDVHNVKVLIGYGTNPTERRRETWREFVVDIPASKSVDLTVAVVFPRLYGFVIAQVLQVTEHSPWPPPSHASTDDDKCAFRLVGAAVAPPGYIASLGSMSGCPGSR